jgi:hypothetical protein
MKFFGGITLNSMDNHVLWTTVVQSLEVIMYPST